MQNNKTITPYNDDFMTFDELSGRYVITETGLERKGIFLRRRIERHNANYVSTIINAYCETVANHIYTYMSAYTVDPNRLASCIARSVELRRAIFNAQAEQAKFVYFNGDQTLSVKADERMNYIAPLAAAALRDAGLLYAGGY